MTVPQLIVQVSAFLETHADAAAELERQSETAERWLYVTGRFASGPGVRVRNIEGLGDDWLALRNAALSGCSPGSAFDTEPSGYFANGCVALALRDILATRPAPWPAVIVRQTAHAPVSLEASLLSEGHLARLVGAYISGDAWRLSSPEWSLVVAALSLSREPSR